MPPVVFDKKTGKCPFLLPNLQQKACPAGGSILFGKHAPAFATHFYILLVGVLYYMQQNGIGSERSYFSHGLSQLELQRYISVDDLKLMLTNIALVKCVLLALPTFFQSGMSEYTGVPTRTWHMIGSMGMFVFSFLKNNALSLENLGSAIAFYGFLTAICFRIKNPVKKWFWIVFYKMAALMYCYMYNERAAITIFNYWCLVACFMFGACVAAAQRPITEIQPAHERGRPRSRSTKRK